VNKTASWQNGLAPTNLLIKQQVDKMTQRLHCAILGCWVKMKFSALIVQNVSRNLNSFKMRVSKLLKLDLTRRPIGKPLA